MLDMGGLRFFAAQKLPPRRQVKEQLPHFDTGPSRAAGSFDLQDFPATDNDLRAFGRVSVTLAGGQGEAAHAGDTGQGLTPKTHRRDSGEVFGAPDLAGGMALKTQQRIVPAHAG